LQVRSCAQRVIDTVNESFKEEKDALESASSRLFTQMQTLSSQSEMGPHLNRHLQMAPSAQAQQQQQQQQPPQPQQQQQR
jgi:hypothetical protein